MDVLARKLKSGVDGDLPFGWQSFTAVKRRVRLIAEAMMETGRDAHPNNY